MLSHDPSEILFFREEGKRLGRISPSRVLAKTCAFDYWGMRTESIT